MSSIHFGQVTACLQGNVITVNVLAVIQMTHSRFEAPEMDDESEESNMADKFEMSEEPESIEKSEAIGLHKG